MNFFKYAQMPFSFEEGWPQAFEHHPSVARTFFFLVLPFSLLAPAMLIFAGNSHPSAYLMDPSFARWQAVALIFFIGELITVPLMGKIVQEIASVHKIAVRYRDAFLLAAITSIPLHLSSLGLAIPSLVTMLAVVIIGFGFACALLYHGIDYMLGLTDKMQAQEFSTEVIATGALVWALLCGFILLTLT